jgi:hypothetical protein
MCAKKNLSEEGQETSTLQQVFLIRIVGGGGGGGHRMGPHGTSATNWPIVLAPGNYEDGEVGWMMIGRGNWSTRRKPAPVPLSPPQTPHAAQTRTRAAAVGSQRLTAWAMARLPSKLHVICGATDVHIRSVKLNSWQPMVYKIQEGVKNYNNSDCGRAKCCKTWWQRQACKLQI